jgi:hypothetical protein
VSTVSYIYDNKIDLNLRVLREDWKKSCGFTSENRHPYHKKMWNFFPTEFKVLAMQLTIRKKNRFTDHYFRFLL